MPRLSLLPLLLLALAACTESPFAPAPASVNCGAADRPCALGCSESCASRVVSAATACMMTLEGTFSASRETCGFPDGSAVRFGGPVPAVPGPRGWDLTLERGGALCLGLTQQPASEGGPARLELRTPQGDYSQELWLASAPDARAALDGRAPDGRALWPPAASRLQVRCPDGRTLVAQGLRCGCGDAGCAGPPLVELLVEAPKGQALVFSLRSGGGERTPLFTCR